MLRRKYEVNSRELLTSNVEDKQDDSDKWDETSAEEQLGGTLDTLMQADDIFSHGSSEVFSFAPAEGNHPVSVFRDKYAEELAFPSI